MPAHPTLLFAVATLLATAAGASEPTSLRAERVDLYDYASFVLPWDEEANPVRCAVIGSEAEWDAVLAPAAVMNDARGFAPPEAFWRDNVLLFAAVSAEGGQDDVFLDAAVRRAGEGIEVSWRRAQAGESSYVETYTLAFAVPRGEAAAVAFRENGETACEAAPR